MEYDIIERIEQRLEQIKHSVKGALTKRYGEDGGRITGVRSLYDMSPIVFSGVNNTFVTNKNLIGSWIAGRCVPLQLLAQPRLTVDITVEQLKRPNPYGLSIDNLCLLAEHQLIYLNFRDYDSTGANGLNDLFKQENGDILKKNLQRMFNFERQIYFGSALRKPIFDAALRNYYGANAPEYETFQQKAYHELTPAFQALKKYTESPKFRGESVSLNAISWHWAFLSAVSNLLPKREIIGNNESGIGFSLFLDAVNKGKKAQGSQLTTDQEAAAKSLIELAKYLRSCHLMYTAPITASFGSKYNMTQDEYNDALKLKVIGKTFQETFDMNKKITHEDFIAITLRVVNEDNNLFNSADIFDGNDIISFLPDLDEKGGEYNPIGDELVNLILHLLTTRQQEITKIMSIKEEFEKAYLGENQHDINLTSLYDDYTRARQDIHSYTKEALTAAFHYLGSPAIGTAIGGYGVGIPYAWQPVSDGIEYGIRKAYDKFFQPDKRILVMQKIHSATKFLYNT